jgi:glucokinase
MIQTKELAIGIDIGGTNLKIGLINEQGQLVEFQSLLLKRNADHSADIIFICEVVRRLLKSMMFHIDYWVGVASPGILNTNSGIVNCAVNLGWENIRLVEMMENSLQLDVSLISNSVAAAVGEQYHSAAGLANYLFICIGTGVGASLVLDYEFIFA